MSGGRERLVYWSLPAGVGDGARPGVLVCHELPGITPEVIAFAERGVAAGFTVAMPHLVGEPTRTMTPAYLATVAAGACISRELSFLARGEASPVTDWLRELGRELHRRAGGAGIGAIGMCFSGNFALTLGLDPHLLAPVLSQPSLPLPLSPSHQRALHATPEAIAALRTRACPVLALRFSADRLVPTARFEALREALGPLAETIEIDNAKGNVHGIKRTAHSVLTNDLVDAVGHPTRAALERVLGFLRERLLPSTSGLPPRREPLSRTDRT